MNAPKASDNITLASAQTVAPAQLSGNSTSTSFIFESDLNNDASNISAKSVHRDHTARSEETPPSQTLTPSFKTTPVNPYHLSTIKHSASNCDGKNCPNLKVSMVVFKNKPRINAFLDQALASLGEDDSNAKTPHQSLKSFETWFLQNAKPGASVTLDASIARDSKEIVVLKLESYVFMGGANGLSSTQYINWLPLVDKILVFDAMILPGREAAFEQILKTHHSQWLKNNASSIGDQVAFTKIWPFIPSSNVGLLDTGMIVSYDPVMIAPKVYGQPSFLLSYAELQGILRPELIPRPNQTVQKSDKKTK